MGNFNYRLVVLIAIPCGRGDRQTLPVQPGRDCVHTVTEFQVTKFVLGHGEEAVSGFDTRAMNPWTRMLQSLYDAISAAGLDDAV